MEEKELDFLNTLANERLASIYNCIICDSYIYHKEQDEEEKAFLKNHIIKNLRYFAITKNYKTIRKTIEKLQLNTELLKIYDILRDVDIDKIEHV